MRYFDSLLPAVYSRQAHSSLVLRDVDPRTDKAVFFNIESPQSRDMAYNN